MPHRSVLRNQQTGFSLVEVLVSVVVFSFGLLGVVGMQLAALQGNRDAQLQASAVRFARELAELMRANQTVASAPVGSNPYLMNVTSASTNPIDSTICYRAACGTQDAVAISDVADWLDRIYDPATGLPGVRVVVCYDTTPYEAGGLPRWACTGGTGQGVAYIKIGWTQRSLNRAADGTAGNAVVDLATDANARPSIVMPVTAGIQGVL